ncbi:MAG: single-stranded-DNA-specific exonuclease RecJ [Dehalococcoidia bacterium]|nr:MAG: single-stranded-DNA-specific exonuclease RecJ [Dehalococcoidia bacterium]
MNRQIWQICPPVPADIIAQRLQSVSSEREYITLLIIQLLENRGISNPTDFEPFLTADDRLAHAPRLLPDMDRAVTRMLRALLGDELIAVYGDFDADGITGTVLLMEGISRLGGRVVHYIPHRLDEGHGLNLPALQGLKQQGVSLVVTVDCGIGGGPEIKQGLNLGLDFIITDHHEVPDSLPPALAAINPKRADSTYPFCELAGVGVALKLLQAVFEATNGNTDWEEYLDLVALGTVADMVPLGGENRYLVKRGIEVLNRSQRIGVQELVRCAGLQMGKLDEDSIGYMLGPRLNASGRMDHAVTSYELLMTTALEQARQLAAELESSNSERQRLTAEVYTNAREKLLLEGVDKPLLMIGEGSYPPGVVGVVAGKLADEFYRPTIVLQFDGEQARGSARSIPEFDILGALTECKALLTRFGGHRQAAGFIALKANVEKLHWQLQQIAARELADVDLRPAINIDAEIPIATVDAAMYKSISKLAPFGQGNQIPTFLSRKVRVLESRRVGATGDHLKLKLRNNRVVWDAIAFNQGNRETSSYIDIVYNLEQEDWNGRRLLRLNIVDFLPSL